MATSPFHLSVLPQFYAEATGWEVQARAFCLLLVLPLHSLLTPFPNLSSLSVEVPGVASVSPWIGVGKSALTHGSSVKMVFLSLLVPRTAIRFPKTNFPFQSSPLLTLQADKIHLYCEGNPKSHISVQMAAGR